MVGYVVYGGENRTGVEPRQLLGARFLTVSLAAGRRPMGAAALYRARRAAGRLAELGVRRAVFPREFPYLPIFARRGICPVETLPLRQALAAPLARRRLAELGIAPTRAVAAVSAARLSREVAETVTALALGCRYVMLQAPDGGGLARSLRREYGVSLLLDPGREQLDRADALLLFAPREDLARTNPVFYALYPGGETGPGGLPLPLPGALAETVEPSCGREQLTAALWQMGAITKEAILSEIP